MTPPPPPSNLPHPLNPPPWSPRPRLLPEIALPVYTYVPGQSPHPHASPDGHGFGADLPAIETLDGIHWSACLPYRLGIDLFNHGYHWEAHESWESLWHAAGRKGSLADFFKGLIQLAVVGVKIREEKPTGVEAHASRAVELFAQVERETGGDSCWGLPLAGLRRFAEVARRHPIEGSPEPVVVVFDELLWPGDDAALRYPIP
jgi:hypothetical protein